MSVLDASRSHKHVSQDISAYLVLMLLRVPASLLGGGQQSRIWRECQGYRGAGSWVPLQILIVAALQGLILNEGLQL